ncbi:membrane protein [Prolixibacter bellariivorans]|uniref:Membrane protein n=1 Tax=Prolixibacter bellariivorans TaxID=314319 RepID=A0A5M4AX85_9BACT|nr:DUF2723 domain-containing protein [Prolixibacter bellariivorans]GET32520.1 membrane protein [Prolixibacter bellariivorans]
MSDFHKKNVVLGWIIFGLSATVYLLTLEPTVSFWDCGEFLAASYKLQIGHPPGAPLYLMVARIFSLLTSDPAKVAHVVNSFSGLISGATIMFLFWTITHLARMLMPNPKELKSNEQILVLGSGLVGALAYAFTDTFWFSAVEAEVYAFSSFFTAVVFWAILRWEEEAEKPRANRWIVLIAYLMGLSIGVHLLNLLAIPAMVFIFYFKKYETSRKGFVITLLAAMAILGTIMWGIIPGVPKIAGWFEIVAVNGMNLPYNSGLLIFVAIIITGLAYGIFYTYREKKFLANTILLSVLMLIVGYSSYSLIIIRSGANPPMDENNPDNVFSLESYLNRTQYGETPLVYGRYYNAPVIDEREGKTETIQENGKYKDVIPFPAYEYDSRFKTVFPRMYSNVPSHVQAYKTWGGTNGTPLPVNNDGQTQMRKKPSFGDNLRFFFSYQTGFMYFRYFMWNFVGRQNDIQGYGGVVHGNWISGINFLDDMRLGPQEDLPSDLKNNKARNRYYFLPLLLGLLGFFFQYSRGKRGRQDWWVVFLLFIFTGLAIVVYLNQTPFQPRERDYAYVGSFYAFAIWIGMGVLGLYELLSKHIRMKKALPWMVTAVAMVVPVILIAQNYNDHDRSNRYMARDYARNYLESCAPNAILFTYGDNDTFPLWYVQDVEGVRPDVRICNLSLLGMDWYITEMKSKAYDSAPLPISLKDDTYRMGKRDYIPVIPKFKKAIPLKDAVDIVASDDPRSKIPMQNGDNIDFLPANVLYMPINKQKVLKNGTVAPEDAADIADTVTFHIGASSLSKSDFAVLDMIATDNWSRPIYFDLSAVQSLRLGLQDYLQLEGLAYRLVPIKTPSDGISLGRVNSRILYHNLMGKFTWGNISDTTIWVDDNNVKEVKIIDAKPTFNRLAQALLAEGKRDSAINVLNRCVATFPNRNIPYGYEDFDLAETYYEANAPAKANAIISKLAHLTLERLNYYVNLPSYLSDGLDRERQRQLAILSNCVHIAKQYKQDDLSKELDDRLNELINRYSLSMK